MSKVPHLDTIQKFAGRISGTVLESILSNFILLIDIKQIFLGIGATGFKQTHTSHYYTERARLRKKWVKLSIGAVGMLKQVIICAIKIRPDPAIDDNVDFRSMVERAAEIKPLSIVVVARNGYDSGDNHELVRDELKACNIIPAIYQDVPIWKTHGRYGKQMKRG